MDKIQPSLIINYFRQNGRPYKRSAGAIFPTGQVHALIENLVPGISGSDSDLLTAIGNSLYVEARRHNMSMSPFGHLDPIKFAVAGTYIGAMLAEIKRDIAIAGHYEFGNVNFGNTLAVAANVQLNSVAGDYANFCKKYNIVAAKANSLYIPVTGLLHRWYPHRINIYKDDAGDRYSLYLYNMANYYELNTDPNSATVGQLLYKRFYSYPASAGSTGIVNDTIVATIQQKLSIVEDLIDKYLADDDFASFVSEALQAKMPTVHFDAIKLIGSSEYELLPLKLVYSLDDILALENATFASPICTTGNYDVSGSNWDIKEDANGVKLIVGWSNGVAGRLPAFAGIGTNVSPAFNGRMLSNESIGNRPLTTHAQITSTIGMTNWTRYIVGFGDEESGGIRSHITNQYYTVFRGRKRQVYTIAQAETTTNFQFIPITCASTEIIESWEVYLQEAGTSTVNHLMGRGFSIPNYGVRCIPLERVGFKYTALDFNSVYEDKVALTGFKSQLTSIMDGNPQVPETFLTGDFDYLVTLNQDSVMSFFVANAWNDLQLTASDATYSGSSEPKFNKGKKNKKAKSPKGENNTSGEGMKPESTETK